jgi:hypothetical protein
MPQFAALACDGAPVRLFFQAQNSRFQAAVGEAHLELPGRWAATRLHQRNLQRGTNRFDFGVLLQHFVAHFAAPAGLLVSAKGQGGIENVVAVNPYRSGA